MAISMKTLKAVLGNAVRTQTNADTALRDIRAALVAFDKREINRDRALHEINQALEAHGVESIPHPDHSDRYLADYVNTGDTYSPTIVFSYRTGRFYATSWGDWYEHSPEYRAYSLREYRAEQARERATQKSA